MRMEIRCALLTIRSFYIPLLPTKSWSNYTHNVSVGCMQSFWHEKVALLMFQLLIHVIGIYCISETFISFLVISYDICMYYHVSMLFDVCMYYHVSMLLHHSRLSWFYIVSLTLIAIPYIPLFHFLRGILHHKAPVWCMPFSY